MAFDFPTGIAVGQIYTSADGVIFTWDGEKWMKGIPLGVVVPPPGPVIPPVGNDGEALVAAGGNAVWGAPIIAGTY